MKKLVTFIHGGGDGGYEPDAKLAASLQTELGETYKVQYPKMPDEALPDFGWIEKIGKEISLTKNELILVGHSLGASMLLKYLSENRVQKKINGLFLLAPPYWSGNENWKQGLKLHKDFADKIPKNIPVFLYHCKDDEVVPLVHLEYYAQNMPQAKFRKTAQGGHQFNNDLSLMAKDIKSL